MKNFEYAQPKTIEDIFQFLDSENVIIKSGGIDQIDLMKEGIIQPKRMVNIRFIEELNFIRKKSP